MNAIGNTKSAFPGTITKQMINKSSIVVYFDIRHLILRPAPGSKVEEGANSGQLQLDGMQAD
jgi:hypothetical protein